MTFFSGLDKPLMADMDTDGIVEYTAGVLELILFGLVGLTVELNKFELSEFTNKMKKHYPKIEKNEIIFPKIPLIEFDSLAKKMIMLQNAEEKNKQAIQNLIDREEQLNAKEIILKKDIEKRLPLNPFFISERLRSIANARDSLNQATKLIEKEQQLEQQQRQQYVAKKILKERNRE